jgi:hypothetical protein
MEHEQQSEAARSQVSGQRFRRNVVAVGAAFGLTLAGLGVAGANVESASEKGPTGAGEVERADRPSPRHHREARGHFVDVAADAIGITADELRTELKAGKSIAAVAQSRGVEPAKVIDSLVAAAESRLEERFTNLIHRTPGDRPASSNRSGASA